MVADTSSKKHKHRTYLYVIHRQYTYTMVNVFQSTACNVYLLVRYVCCHYFNDVNVTVPEIKCSPCNVLHEMFNNIHVMFYGGTGAFAEVVTERE